MVDSSRGPFESGVEIPMDSPLEATIDLVLEATTRSHLVVRIDVR